MNEPSATVCGSCGYALAGLRTDRRARVACPECGLRQIPMSRRRLSITQWFLWCCLAPLCACSCCAAILLLWAREMDGLLLAAAGAVLAGVLGPLAYAWRLALTREDVRPRVILALIVVGWGANVLMGICFMSWAVSQPWMEW